MIFCGGWLGSRVVFCRALGDRGLGSLRVLQGLAHCRIFLWFELAISEQIHVLTDILLDQFELALLNKLGERIDLLLVEKSHEIVAKAAHFRVSVYQQLLDVAFFAHFLHFVGPFQTLELTARFRKGAFARKFFKN